VLAAGRAHAGVDPWLADLGDAALRVELVEVGSVLFTVTEPGG
jgi:hypothetical protein